MSTIFYRKVRSPRIDDVTDWLQKEHTNVRLNIALAVKGVINIPGRFYGPESRLVTPQMATAHAVVVLEDAMRLRVV